MFTYFFDTKYTIPEGLGFSQFSLQHFIELGIVLLICVLTVIAFRRKDQDGRLRMLRVIAILLIIDELAKYAVTAATGNFRIDFLPFHLCSINIFVIAAYAIRPSDKLADYLYTVCLPTAIIALLCPSWAALPFCNFMHLHSLSCHLMLALFPVLLLADGFKPSFRRFIRVLPYCIPVVILVFIFNKIFGTNFMFLNSGSSGGSGNPLAFLETYIGPFYLLGIPVIAVLLLGCMYGIPSLVRNAKDRK